MKCGLNIKQERPHPQSFTEVKVTLSLSTLLSPILFVCIHIIEYDTSEEKRKTITLLSIPISCHCQGGGQTRSQSESDCDLSVYLN